MTADQRREDARQMVEHADRILAEIDARMADCPEGHRCCRFRNADADERGDER